MTAFIVRSISRRSEITFGNLSKYAAEYFDAPSFPQNLEGDQSGGERENMGKREKGGN